MPFWNRVMLSASAAPSSGVPSWKVTPGLAFIVQTVLSALGVRLSSRYGDHPPSSLGTTMGSNTVLMTWWHPMAQTISAGIHGELVSASMPMITLPPAVGCSAGVVVVPASEVGASLPAGAAVSGAAVTPVVLSELSLPPPPHAAASRPSAAAVAAIATHGRRLDPRP